MISRLNDIFVVSVSFLFSCFSFLSGFLVLIFHSIIYRFNDKIYRLNEILVV